MRSTQIVHCARGYSDDTSLQHHALLWGQACNGILSLSMYNKKLVVQPTFYFWLLGAGRASGLTERDKEYSERRHAVNIRESDSKSLAQGNVFHVLILRLFTEKAISICRALSKCESSVTGAIVILGCSSELKGGTCRLFWILCKACVKVTSTPKPGKIPSLQPPKPEQSQAGRGAGRKVRVAAGRFCFSVHHPESKPGRNY